MTSASGDRIAAGGAKSTAPEGGPGSGVGRLTRTGGWLLLLMVLGAALRVYRLPANSLWVDEFATLKIVTLPFSEILRASAEVNFCPPLYFWLVHGVISVFGESETSLRLVSVLAGVLTIPAAWLLAREVTEDSGVAWLCATLLAFNPLHLWYSQEARPYALLVLVGAVALLFFLRAARTNGVAHWTGFVGSMSLVLLTHPVGLTLLGVTWVWALLWPRRAAVLRPLSIATVLVGLACAPFALPVADAVARAAGVHSPPRPLTGLELPYTLLTFVGGYSFGPPLREIQNVGAGAAVRRHFLESAAGAAAVAGLLLLALRYRSPSRKYFAVLLFLPILGMLLGSATSGKAYQVRYAVVGLIGYCALVAGALRALPLKIGRACIAVLLALSIWADVQWYVSPAYWKDDSRAVVGWLAERLPQGASVAVAPSYVVGVLAHYAQLQGAKLRFVAADQLMDSGRPAALLLTRLHHVDNQVSLRQAFRQTAGPSLAEASVGGYYILLNSPTGTMPGPRE